MGPSVVLDTNVLVSALRWPGTPSEVFQLVLEESLTLVSCRQQIDELRRVLGYEKLGVLPHERERLLAVVESIAVMVNVEGVVRCVEDDPTDDIILELALKGHAVCIVSGDHHLLQLHDFEGIPIKTPSVFLLEFRQNAF